MIFQIDKTIYEQLSETERHIVDFISQNEDKISYLSITNIADKTFSSPATVSRTIQKCGFKGIAELRYLISKENKDKSKNVSPYAINKLLDKVYQESTQTIENIPIPAILKAIDHINNAEKIFIYARGFTAMFAEHFQMYLQLMGYNAVVVKDVKWMEQTKNLVTSADTVFVLSVRNTTPELAQSLRVARHIGARTVVCCCKSMTELEKYADVVLIGHSNVIMEEKGLTVYSHLPLLIITETIINYLSTDAEAL